MTVETVELDVTLLMKADGSDSAWQMQRLCKGLNVSPGGVYETYMVTTDRENAERLLDMDPDQLREWARGQRFGPNAFYVYRAWVKETNPKYNIAALAGDIERQELEKQLAVANARAEELEKQLAIMMSSTVADSPVYEIPGGPGFFVVGCPAPDPAPTCDTCGGTGRVTVKDYDYVDRFTKWERRTEIQSEIDCPDCCGGTEPAA